MVDAAGTRSLLARDVKGGEYITLDAPFVKESVVTIYLGGEFVWQERYK
jgi:serine/threonine-protein kinase